MAFEEEEKAIYERNRQRWLELEKEIALKGMDVEPHITIEAEELRRKYGFRLTRQRVPVEARGVHRDDEIEWLRVLIGSALRSTAQLKQAYDDDIGARARRQAILNIWLGVLTVLQVIVVIIMYELVLRFIQ